LDSKIMSHMFEVLTLLVLTKWADDTKLHVQNSLEMQNYVLYATSFVVTTLQIESEETTKKSAQTIFQKR